MLAWCLNLITIQKKMVGNNLMTNLPSLFAIDDLKMIWGKIDVAGQIRHFKKEGMGHHFSPIWKIWYETFLLTKTSLCFWVGVVGSSFLQHQRQENMPCSEQALVRLFYNLSSSSLLLLLFLYFSSILLARLFYFIGSYPLIQRSSIMQQFSSCFS